MVINKTNAFYWKCFNLKTSKIDSILQRHCLKKSFMDVVMGKDQKFASKRSRILEIGWSWLFFGYYTVMITSKI